MTNNKYEYLNRVIFEIRIDFEINKYKYQGG